MYLKFRFTLTIIIINSGSNSYDNFHHNQHTLQWLTS